MVVARPPENRANPENLDWERNYFEQYSTAGDWRLRPAELSGRF